jgi:arginine/lysine/ornithine decarboxylase
VRTTQTTSPLHALTMLNDPTWVEAARVLAERVSKEQPDDDARLARAYALILSRPPTAREQALLRNLLARQRAVYADDPKSAEALLAVGARPRDAALKNTEQAALTAACLALLNLDAAQTRD